MVNGDLEHLAPEKNGAGESDEDEVMTCADVRIGMRITKVLGVFFYFGFEKKHWVGTSKVLDFG